MSAADDESARLPTLASDSEGESDYDADDGEEEVDFFEAFPHNTLTWRFKRFADAPFHKEKEKVVLRSDRTTTADAVWRIELFPYSFPPRATSKYLGLFCELCDEEVEQGFGTKRARIVIEVRNHKSASDSIVHEYNHEYSSQAMDIGSPEAAKRALVLDPENGFLDSDGALTVVVTFWRLPNLETRQQAHEESRDYRALTGYVGLRNQGATCYMNSLLQALYHTTAFARAVFLVPTEKDEPTKSVALALQRVFFNLKYAKQAVSTKELTQSFGWDKGESFYQHDVQELSRVLIDNLESKMRGTPAEGMLARLLSGSFEHRIHCTKVKFDSTRQEPFYDVSLDIGGCKDLYESLDRYTQAETLDGDNKYDAGELGRQPAEKSCKFYALPPVLHMQLKRWVYDVEKDASVKLNSRFEFPLTLDLQRYMAADAPSAPPSIYQLHAVLIHSGGAGGGHYYLYMRPTPRNKWYRFNDSVVEAVKSNAIMEDGFGGERYTYLINGVRVMANNKPYTNAYMLIYVRKSDIRSVFYHLHSRDIPLHLHKRFADDLAHAEKEQEEEHRMVPEKPVAQLQQQRQQQATTQRVRLVTTSHLRAATTSRDLYNPEDVPVSREPRDTTLEDFYAIAAATLGVEPEFLRLYPFDKRNNGDQRVLPCLQSTRLAKLGSIASDQLDFFAEVLPGARPLAKEQQEQAAVAAAAAVVGDDDGDDDGGAPVTSPEEAAKAAKAVPLPKKKENTVRGSHRLLFVKRYDPDDEKVVFVGTLHADSGDKWGSMVRELRRLAGLGEDESMLVYDDRKDSSRLDTVPAQATLRELRVQHGDVLVVQREPAKDAQLRYPLLPDLLRFTTDLVLVRFVPLGTERSGKNSELFQLRLPRAAEYGDVVRAVGSHLGADPAHVRLTGHDPYFARAVLTPYRAAAAPSLQQMLRQDQLADMGAGMLYFEVLDVPTAVAETCEELRVRFVDAHVKTVAEHTLRVPKGSLVRDVLARVAELHPSDAEHGGSGQYRLCEVLDGHIKEARPDDKVAALASVYGRREFRAEEVPLAELQVDPAQAARVQFVHYQTDFSGAAEYYGEPFYMVVKCGATAKEVLEQVQKKLQLSSALMDHIKLADADRASPAVLRSTEIALTPSGLTRPKVLGLNHRKPASHAHGKERAIVIKG